MLPTPLGKGALQNPAVQPPRQVSLSIVLCGWACVTSRNEGKHVGGGGAHTPARFLAVHREHMQVFTSVCANAHCQARD